MMAISKEELDREIKSITAKMESNSADLAEVGIYWILLHLRFSQELGYLNEVLARKQIGILTDNQKKEVIPLGESIVRFGRHWYFEPPLTCLDLWLHSNLNHWPNLNDFFLSYVVCFLIHDYDNNKRNSYIMSLCHIKECKHNIRALACFVGWIELARREQTEEFTLLFKRFVYPDDVQAAMKMNLNPILEDLQTTAFAKAFSDWIPMLIESIKQSPKWQLFWSHYQKTITVDTDPIRDLEEAFYTFQKERQQGN